MKEQITFLSNCSGDGSEQQPYAAADGTAGIQAALDALSAHGGALHLPAARYELTKTLLLSLSGSCIQGDVWACNTDPNGVFETAYGTKLRLRGRGFPAVRIGGSHVVSGCLLRELGLQADLVGMDTREQFDAASPTANAGLVLDEVRTDQCTFDRLSFCGFGAGIAVTGQAEVDACKFQDCNLDGCGVGVYFAPRASYYTRIHRCAIADNPYYGVFVDVRGKHMHNLEITENLFVRNGGALVGDAPEQAAVSLLGVSNCAIERNVFDDPGLFWYYPPTATENRAHQPQKRQMPALYIGGHRNRIRDNVFEHSRGPAVIVCGDGNVLMNNISDGDVVIAGQGNYIANLAFTSPDARLILTEKASDTQIFGVDKERIRRL